MSLVTRTALTLLAGLVAVPMTPVSHTSPHPSEASGVPAAYSSSLKEAFLAPDQLTYIRPGLNIRIASVTSFEAGKKPVVEVYLTDDLKGPLDRNGLVTPGVISLRFIPAVWNPATRRYTNYIGYNANPALNANPSRDNTGTWQELEVGHYKYTFSNALPATMDASKPHTLAVMGSRNTTDIIGKQYYAVPVYLDFIPATGGTATTFNATVVAKCNQCHDPIAPHGGNYRDIKTCVLCHNPNNMTGTIGTAGTEGAEPRSQYDGQIFFHALHMGKNPEVVPNITYPQDIRNCETCHDKASAGGASWYSYPSSAACGSCHDDVNFATGANHANVGPATDATCKDCHTPQGNEEWDAGVKFAHVVPLHSAQLKGYTAAILSVSNAGPGKKITVTYRLKNGNGTFVDPAVYKVAANGSLSIKLGGPTSDYTNVGMLANGQPFSESPAAASTYDAATGIATYTFTNAIPAAAKGTYVVSIETRRPIVLNPAPVKGPATVNEGAPNVPFYFAVTGTVTPRRTSVALAKCNACHQDLAVLFSHGNQRIAIEHCVICHNPNGNDSGRRTDPATLPGESIQFSRMIHRIHTGEELAQDYTIYGFGGTPATFNEVTYPGDRRNCLACHVNAAAVSLPLPITNQPVVTDRDFFSPMGSATAACTGCHDSRDVVSHAFINTSFFPKNPTVPAEACGTCHGTGADLDVAKVHAR